MASAPGASPRVFQDSTVRSLSALVVNAVLPSPRRYSVTNPGPFVAGRRDEIVRQMRSLGGRSWLRDVLPGSVQ